MTELVTCSACRRHVDVRETVCPFCAAPLSARRPQRALVTRLTRAAIFSAATTLAACSDKPAPAPAPAVPPVPSTGSGDGSDDLEKLLDRDERLVEHPAPPLDAAVPDAPSPDAGVAVDAAVDAGVDPALAEQRRRRERLRLERQREQERIERVDETRWREMAKPYGAPPARRRVV